MKQKGQQELPTERLYGYTVLNNHDFRKKSPSFQDLAGHKTNLKLSPTNVAPSVILEGEDYGLKASINDLHNLRG
jgi:hypothetical protein